MFSRHFFLYGPFYLLGHCIVCPYGYWFPPPFDIFNLFLQSPSWSLIDDSGFSIFSYSRHHGLSLITQDFQSFLTVAIMVSHWWLRIFNLFLQSPSWSLVDDSGFSIFSYSRHHGLSLMTQDLHYLKQFPFILPGLQHLQTLAITLNNTCGTRSAFPYGAPEFTPGFWWGQCEFTHKNTSFLFLFHYNYWLLVHVPLVLLRLNGVWLLYWSLTLGVFYIWWTSLFSNVYLPGTHT